MIFMFELKWDCIAIMGVYKKLHFKSKFSLQILLLRCHRCTKLASASTADVIKEIFKQK